MRLLKYCSNDFVGALIILTFAIIGNSSLSLAFSLAAPFFSLSSLGQKHSFKKSFGFKSARSKANTVASLRSQANDNFNLDIEDDDDDDDDDDENEFLPVDFRTFMTQRSIQSFLFLLAQTRDPHTIKWLDGFLQPYLVRSASKFSFDPETVDIKDPNVGWGTSVSNDKNLSSKLLYYHGISAFKASEVTSWDFIFLRLLEEPSSTLYIQTNNPRIPEFEVDIDPSRLCSRILSVRDQISKEWIEELEVISNLGVPMFSSYWEHVQKGDGVGFDRASQLFLEEVDAETGFKPSPLRKANYDLLLRLVTQVSICRVLQREGGVLIDEGDSAQKKLLTRSYLKEFYSERKYKYFKGNIGKYGRTDDFLEELMLSPPRMVLNEQNQKSNDETNALFVDPLGIAEIVVRERERVATEWKNLIIEVISKGTDQVELRQQMLNRMMGI